MTSSPSAPLAARVFEGETAIGSIAADDRGFAYGDGLFETLRAHRGTLPWWDAHWARLQRGAERLQLALPDPALVRSEAAKLLGGADAVLKLLVSRGRGGRGYRPDRDAMPTWVLSTHPLPASASALRLRWCDTRLALQPALAGLKHCNRLEQVLARAEWNAGGIDADEGLMRSTEGDVVCATAANLFVLRRGRWCTPPVDRCGVAGVCRAWVLGAVEVEETRLQAADVEGAGAVFLCNAVRGILPVAQLGARRWAPHPQVAGLQRHLARVHPAFSLPETP
jgi:4-amino-4-deoxychorismate lyase